MDKAVPDPVYSLYAIEGHKQFLDFVGLQMADEMPSDIWR